MPLRHRNDPSSTTSASTEPRVFLAGSAALAPGRRRIAMATAVVLVLVLALAAVAAQAVRGAAASAEEASDLANVQAAAIGDVERVEAIPAGVDELKLERLALASVPTPEPAPHTHELTVWDRLADCESGDWYDGKPGIDTRRWDYGLSFSHGDIFEGGLNFHPGTWDSFRDAGMPDHAGRASREQQIVVGQRVLDAQGWGAWPVCSRMLGLR